VIYPPFLNGNEKIKNSNTETIFLQQQFSQQQIQKQMHISVSNGRKTDDHKRLVWKKYPHTITKFGTDEKLTNIIYQYLCVLFPDGFIPFTYYYM
jgi:hypothetical protein